MRLHAVATLLASTASLTPAVLGWGAAGHEIVATIAQIHLHPSVLPALCKILDYHSPNPNEPECHLAPIAVWADKIRWKERWSASLHYIGAVGDDPSQTCVFPGNRGWAGRDGMNVIGALRNDTGILREWVNGDVEDDLANEALKFFVHFLGDMHQPLHLTGRDRGGNGDKVLFDGRQTNLHSLWDGLLIAKSLRTLPYNYTRPIPVEAVEYNLRGAIYDPLIRRIMWEGIMQEWKDDLGAWLACPTPSTPDQAVFSVLPKPMKALWDFFTYDSVSDGDDESFCPYHWAQPLHELNCDIVWPPALDEPPYKNAFGMSMVSMEHDHHEHLSAEEEMRFFDAQGTFVGGPQGGHSDYVELDTPEYAGKIAKDKLVEKLLAQAGIRLAGVLNGIFAETGQETK